MMKRIVQGAFRRISETPMWIDAMYTTALLPKQWEKISDFREGDNWCLIILDACRYDVFEEIHDEYLTGELEAIKSAGKNTFDYVRLNWPEYHEVTYVTAAPPINNKGFEFDEDERADGLVFTGEGLESMYNGYVPAEHISDIIEVWKTHWDEDLGVCPPEPVTETALKLKDTKLVCHYFQPHAPYIGEKNELSTMERYDVDVTGGAVDADIWHRVKEGEISDKELRTLYNENLRRALQSVCELIENSDFDRYAIVGDHGEALGEYNTYTHSTPRHPQIRKVPWFEVSEVNKDYPKVKYDISSRKEHDKSVESRLAELGYIDN